MPTLRVVIAISIMVSVIVIHELGHFVAAWSVGIKMSVRSIQIGLFKPRFQLTTIKGIPIYLSPWLVAGGIDIDSQALYSAPLWKQLIVYAGGVLANFAAAYLAAITLLGGNLGNQVSQEIISAGFQANNMLLTGQIAFSQLSSIIGVIKLCADLLITDLLTGTLLIWLLLHFITGTMNLIPVPGLDGGQILFAITNTCFPKTDAQVKIKATNLVNTIFILGIIFLVIIPLSIRDIIQIFAPTLN